MNATTTNRLNAMMSQLYKERDRVARLLETLPGDTSYGETADLQNRLAEIERRIVVTLALGN